MLTIHSHCSYCGQPFPATAAWPRRCGTCGNESYVNPIPVAVALLPVDGGLIVIRRGIEPRKGELAFPGGFIDMGEDWRSAAARELLEETGIATDAKDYEIFSVESTPNGRQILLFCLNRTSIQAALPEFKSDGETTERSIIYEPVPMAFPLHEKIAERYFAMK